MAMDRTGESKDSQERHLPVGMSQTRIVPSKEEDRRRLPSGEKARSDISLE
jgi:hypothetical protein